MTKLEFNYQAGSFLCFDDQYIVFAKRYFFLQEKTILAKTIARTAKEFEEMYIFTRKEMTTRARSARKKVFGVFFSRELGEIAKEI